MSEPRRQVLVVDDDEANRVAIAAALEPLGYDIVTARSGTEALERLNEVAVAAVLIDVRMPVMSGFETAAHIRRRLATREVPIIFITGAELEAQSQAYISGGSDFVHKPIQPAVLQAKVQRLIELAPVKPRGETSLPVNVLVVDDRPHNRDAISAALEGLGERVVLAGSSAEALRALLTEDFAVALVDVSMPGVDGFALVEEIRRRPKTSRLPVIFITAIRQAAEDVLRGYAMGAVDYLFVPFPDDILRAKVAVFVELYRRRRIQERQVLATRDQIDHLLAVTPAVLFVLRSTRSQPEYVSPSIERVFGWSPRQAMDETEFWSDRVHPDDWPRVLDFRTRAAGAGAAGFEYRFRSADSGYRWVHEEIRATPDGRPGQFVGSILDVTVHRELEASIQQAQKMDSIGLFASGIAHDFNNLLTVISGFCSLLGERLADDGAGVSELDQIRNATARASELTHQLLAFCRKQAQAPAVVDLNAVVRGLTAMLPRLLGEDIQLVVRPSPAPVWVLVDRAQIEQVIVNLAANARDAMPTGGQLLIETAAAAIDEAAGHALDLPPGEYYRLRVADTGCGMDDKTLRRIFEPFFTTKTRGHGTGLGLSMVYGIVRQSGGSLDAHSEPGRGSTFDIMLPVASEAAAPAALPSAAPVTIPHGRETVVVLDDDEHVRALARTALERHGYTVLEASSGADAIARAAQYDGRIDLIVADMVLPGGVSGLEAVERIRGDRPGLRALHMSGYSEEVIAARVADPGVHDMLHKPFDAAQLLRAVRRVLDAGGGDTAAGG